MTLPRRAAAMQARLMDTAARLGLARAELDILRRAFAAAMDAPRGALDPQHPDYLHTARTALILMDDVGLADPWALAAALVAETRDPSLAPRPAATARIGAAVTTILAAVPARDEEERLLEMLLAAPPEARAVALAERLDHARHLHLRERDEWDDYHRITCSAYAPVAARDSAVLGRRFGWWCETFRRRFLPA